MLRRDYVQKMIEEFARAVAHALKLNTEGNKQEAIRRLRESFATFFNEDPEAIRHMHPSNVLKKLVTEDGLTPQQVETFAYGLRAEADILVEIDAGQAKDRYVKALALYEYADAQDTDNYSVSRKHAIEEVKSCISAL
jgi:hypothetical protein